MERHSHPETGNRPGNDSQPDWRPAVYVVNRAIWLRFRHCGWCGQRPGGCGWVLLLGRLPSLPEIGAIVKAGRTGALKTRWRRKRRVRRRKSLAIAFCAVDASHSRRTTCDTGGANGANGAKSPALPPPVAAADAKPVRKGRDGVGSAPQNRRLCRSPGRVTEGRTMQNRRAIPSLYR
jgi:hypothetical protein